MVYVAPINLGQREYKASQIGSNSYLACSSVELFYQVNPILGVLPQSNIQQNFTGIRKRQKQLIYGLLHSKKVQDRALYGNQIKLACPKTNFKPQIKQNVSLYELWH
jgi:hypothetical protein